MCCDESHHVCPSSLHTSLEHPTQVSESCQKVCLKGNDLELSHTSSSVGERLDVHDISTGMTLQLYSISFLSDPYLTIAPSQAPQQNGQSPADSLSSK